MDLFYLVVTQTETEQQIVRACNGPVTLGRTGESDIRLRDPRVSRRHVRIVVDSSGRVTVRDLDSTNGTRVAGRRLLGTEATVRLPAAIRIGPYAIEVTRDAEDAVPTVIATQTLQRPLLRFNKKRQRWEIGGKSPQAGLSRQERRFLELVTTAAPAAADAAAIGDTIWGRDQWDRYMLHNLVRRVRKKLAATVPEGNRLIVTVPGVGYRLQEEGAR